MAKKALRKADGTLIALVGDDVSYAQRGNAQHYDVAVEGPDDICRTSQIAALPSGEVQLHNAKRTYRFTRSENGLVYVCNSSIHELDDESKAVLEHLLKERAALFERVRDVRRSFVR